MQLTELPSDIVEYIATHFAAEDTEMAATVLKDAVLRDGGRPDSRMLRCALVSCDHTIDGLKHQIAGLAIDFRDVIVAGEYKRENGELVRASDLTLPFIFEE